MNAPDLPSIFRAFSREAADHTSPLYASLAELIAGDPELLAIAAHGRPPYPNLFLSAVHFLLLRGQGSPELRRCFPSLVDDPAPPDAAFAPLRAFCLDRRDAIIDILRTRLVQTNEARRGGYLLPALGVVARKGGGRPLALVEVGASAGINLCFDRFRFTYSYGKTCGPIDAELAFDVKVKGDLPPPVPAEPPAIAARIGIDLSPIRPGDADGVAWLTALIWPEHRERREVLHRALAAVGRERITWFAGDASLLLPDAIAAAPPSDDATLCVFQTHALNQFPPDARERFTRTLLDASHARPIYFLSRYEALTLERIERGSRTFQALAECDGHGRWVRWLARTST